MNFIDMGLHYGYPTCCIEDFMVNAMVVQFSSGARTTHTEEQNKVSKDTGYTGFVPCQKHAKEILRGEIKLEDLIVNRQCKTPFPQGEHD